jgi:hypothetical protein
VDYFVERRDALRRALESAGRDAAGFTFAGQINVSAEPAALRRGRAVALAFLDAGADHITIGVPGREGPAAVGAMAREVAEPVRDAAGTA